jgi:hypothetical protein
MKSCVVIYLDTNDQGFKKLQDITDMEIVTL